MYADIALIRNDKDTDRLFTYAVPHALRKSIREGCKVSVPFGAGGRPLIGFVFVLHENRPDFDVKSIAGLYAPLYRLSPMQRDLCLWMKETYVCTYAQAIKCVMPAERIAGQMPGLVRTCVLSPMITDGEAIDALVPPNAVLQRKALHMLLEKGSLDVRILKNETGISSSSLKSMASRGHIEIREESTGSLKTACLPEETLPGRRRPIHQACLLQSPERERFYANLAQDVLKAGKSVLLITPDALEAKRLARVLEASLGIGRTFLKHGRSPATGLEPFEKAASQKIPLLLIGTRNALFCDLGPIGAVIVHNENDYGHKSDAMPKYHSRDIARYLSGRHGARLVYSSLSPSLSVYAELKDAGWGNAFLKGVGHKDIPFDIIDMRKELKTGNKGMISRAMLTAVRKRLSKEEAVVVLLNRKGHASHVSCRSCGYVRACPDCGMPLTYYGLKNRLECPHCSYSESPSPACPSCGSRYYRYSGLGPEKVHEELARLLPDVRIAYADRDCMDTKGKLKRMQDGFNRGAFDILIATESILRHPFAKRPALFVLLNADMFLNRQSYTANESFFLLSRKIRAFLPDATSQMMVQTYAPDHPLLQKIVEDDYDGFVEMELRNRRILKLPPVFNLALFHFMGDSEQEVWEAAGLYADLIEKTSPDGRFALLGPSEKTNLRYKARFKLQLAVRYDPVDIREFKGIIKYVNKKARGKLRENFVRLSFDLNIESL